MVLNNAKKAIQCDKQKGPIFGQGPDLEISNDCNKNNQSCTVFPYSFNTETK